MQEAIPYRTYLHASGGRGNDGIGIGGGNTTDAKTTLLLGHGVNPAVFEVEEIDEADVVSELLRINGRKGEDSGGGIQFPAVFVGGELFGGLDQVMAAHISGELVPILKGAGALWL
ncbi:hypothetical protein Dsin_021118 [Dipteronia sinensis]|uniref:Glutaredoxin n=1 Tax=Dipteronia sinensis TaxID=43782 RepID=A0AAE0E473_9ROSI|nr:hypothetical protein Dsin_021118 [Dipteronia sinensis]